MILIEKPQKISALSSGKIDKYEYMTAEKYYLLIKVISLHIHHQEKLEKQTKTIKEQRKKQVQASKALTKEELESIEGLFPRNMIADEK